MNVFIIAIILILIFVIYKLFWTSKLLQPTVKPGIKNILIKLKGQNSDHILEKDCVLDSPLNNTKYEDPDACNIDPQIPFAENQYADALKSFGCDQYLDGAHYDYLPGESRSEYHQRWRERVRAQQVFLPGAPNYC